MKSKIMTNDMHKVPRRSNLQSINQIVIWYYNVPNPGKTKSFPSRGGSTSEGAPVSLAGGLVGASLMVGPLVDGADVGVGIYDDEDNL